MTQYIVIPCVITLDVNIVYQYFLCYCIVLHEY